MTYFILELGDHENVDLDAATVTSATTALVEDGGVWKRGTISASATSDGVTTLELPDAAPLSVYINAPHAVYDPASDRTFIAYLGLERNPYVVSYDHFTGRLSDPVQLGTYPLPDTNDHGAPTIAIDNDGHLHVIWGGHYTAANRHSKSDSPRDISSWTTNTFPAISTYPNLVVTDDGELLLFDRAGSGHGSSFPAHEYIGLRRSTDGGATWGTYTAVVDTTGTPEAASDGYLMAVSYVDGLAHLTWVVARGASHDGTRTNVYHATFNPADGKMRNAAGDDLGTVVTWAEHADCLVHTDAPIDTARHLVASSGRIFVAFPTGTLTSGQAGEYTVNVSTWDGTSWSNVDVSIPKTWRFADACLVEHRGNAVLLAATDSGGMASIGAWVTAVDDGSAWVDAGTVLTGDTGEGFSRVSPTAGGGTWLAVAQQMPTDWDRTDAGSNDLLPLVAIDGLVPLDDDSVAEHTHDPQTITADDVRDVGRWEAVVSGNPAAAVTTPDGADWVYGWVSS